MSAPSPDDPSPHHSGQRTVSTADDWFVEDRHGITYRDNAAPLAGVVAGFFGLVSLAVSFTFVAALRTWQPLGGAIMQVLAVVAFTGFGCTAMALAIAAFSPQHVRFDQHTQRVRGRVRGRLWLPRSLDLDASCLGRPFVQTSSREAGCDLHEVRVPRPGHAPLVLGSYEDPAKAGHWKDRLTLLLSR